MSVNSVRPNPEVRTKLVGESNLTVVSAHLRYRQDQVEFPNPDGPERPGFRGTYTYVDDEDPAVAIVPVRQLPDADPEVLLVWQERYPSQTVGWEVPAGGIKRGESSVGAAQRELLEEASVNARHWYEFPYEQIENVGRGNSRLRVFLATGITAVQNEISRPDPNEVITGQRWATMREIDGMMLDGSITAGHTMACTAMARAFMNLNPEYPRLYQ